MDDIGIEVNPAKVVALLPKGYASTEEVIYIVESVDVRIADKGRVTVMDVSIGTEQYARRRAMAVVMGGGAECLARCLANVPDKNAAALVAVESLEQRTSYLESALGPGLSLEA